MGNVCCGGETSAEESFEKVDVPKSNDTIKSPLLDGEPAKKSKVDESTSLLKDRSNSDYEPPAVDSSDVKLSEEADSSDTPAAEPSKPEPATTAEPKTSSEPAQEPATEPVSEPTPEPASAPAPESTSEPTPEPVSEPAPEPASEPTPEPAPAVDEPAADDEPADDDGSAADDDGSAADDDDSAADDDAAADDEPTADTATEDAGRVVKLSNACGRQIVASVEVEGSSVNEVTLEDGASADAVSVAESKEVTISLTVPDNDALNRRYVLPGQCSKAFVEVGWNSKRKKIFLRPRKGCDVEKEDLDAGLVTENNSNAAPAANERRMSSSKRRRRSTKK
eukprot:Rmarinus@m.18394